MATWTRVKYGSKVWLSVKKYCVRHVRKKLKRFDILTVDPIKMVSAVDFVVYYNNGTHEEFKLVPGTERYKKRVTNVKHIPSDEILVRTQEEGRG